MCEKLKAYEESIKLDVKLHHRALRQVKLVCELLAKVGIVPISVPTYPSSVPSLEFSQSQLTKVREALGIKRFYHCYTDLVEIDKQDGIKVLMDSRTKKYDRIRFAYRRLLTPKDKCQAKVITPTPTPYKTLVCS